MPVAFEFSPCIHHDKSKILNSTIDSRFAIIRSINKTTKFDLYHLTTNEQLVRIFGWNFEIENFFMPAQCSLEKWLPDEVPKKC